jgi:hypothetical protein
VNLYFLEILEVRLNLENLVFLYFPEILEDLYYLEDQ